MAFGEGMKSHDRRDFAPICFGRARSKYDADRLLDGLENPSVDVRLMTVGRTIDHPDIVTRPAQVVAHLLKAGSVQKSSHCNEAHDS
jgi:hypothetical protein